MICEQMKKKSPGAVRKVNPYKRRWRHSQLTRCTWPVSKGQWKEGMWEQAAQPRGCERSGNSSVTPRAAELQVHLCTAGAAKPAGEEGGWNPRGKIFHETLGWGLWIWWSISWDAKGWCGDFSRLPTPGRATPRRVFKGLCWSKIPDVNTLFTNLIAVQKPASLQLKGPNEAH